MKSSAHIVSSTASDKEAGELIANINKLMADAEEMLSESTSQHAEEKVELINPGFYERRRRERAGYAAWKARVVNTVKQADATIRANPYESLLAAVGVGVLLGAICFRRRD